MTATGSQSYWARLFRVACALIDQANAEQTVIDYWTVGGGTAMMLHIDHRESLDLDVFLPDAQLLPFLNPATHDFALKCGPPDTMEMVLDR